MKGWARMTAASGHHPAEPMWRGSRTRTATSCRLVKWMARQSAPSEAGAETGSGLLRRRSDRAIIRCHLGLRPVADESLGLNDLDPFEVSGNGMPGKFRLRH